MSQQQRDIQSRHFKRVPHPCSSALLTLANDNIFTQGRVTRLDQPMQPRDNPVAGCVPHTVYLLLTHRSIPPRTGVAFRQNESDSSDSSDRRELVVLAWLAPREDAGIGMLCCAYEKVVGKSCVGRISEFLRLEPGRVGVCSIPFLIVRKFVGVDRYEVMLFHVMIMCGRWSVKYVRGNFAASKMMIWLGKMG